MARYIDAETLLEFVKQYTPHINGETTMECVETAILNAPTADVVEVRHGHWIEVDDGVLIGDGKHLECSECHIWKKDKQKSNYCSHCGAKMGGGKTE